MVSDSPRKNGYANGYIVESMIMKILESTRAEYKMTPENHWYDISVHSDKTTLLEIKMVTINSHRWRNFKIKARQYRRLLNMYKSTIDVKYIFVFLFVDEEGNEQYLETICNINDIEFKDMGKFLIIPWNSVIDKQPFKSWAHQLSPPTKEINIFKEWE